MLEKDYERQIQKTNGKASKHAVKLVWMRAEDWSEVKRKLRKPTQQLQMRRYDRGSSVHVSWCQLFENLQLTRGARTDWTPS